MHGYGLLLNRSEILSTQISLSSNVAWMVLPGIRAQPSTGHWETAQVQWDGISKKCSMSGPARSCCLEEVIYHATLFSSLALCVYSNILRRIQFAECCQSVVLFYLYRGKFLVCITTGALTFPQLGRPLSLDTEIPDHGGFPLYGPSFTASTFKIGFPCQPSAKPPTFISLMCRRGTCLTTIRKNICVLLKWRLKR